MTDVLCALEDSEGEGSQEVSGGEEASGRPQREASLALQEAGDFFKLRDLVGCEDGFLLQEGKRLSVLSTRVLGDQVADCVVHGVPGLDFRIVEFNVRDWVSTEKKI